MQQDRFEFLRLWHDPAKRRRITAFLIVMAIESLIILALLTLGLSPPPQRTEQNELVALILSLPKAAVEKAKSTDTAKVIKALGEVSFNGPRGIVQMNKSRHTPLSMRLGEVQADGSIKILETFTKVDPGEQCPTIK